MPEPELMPEPDPEPEIIPEPKVAVASTVPPDAAPEPAETTSAAEAMLAELDAVEPPVPDPQPEIEPVAEPKVAALAPVAVEKTDSIEAEQDSEEERGPRLTLDSPVVDAPSIGPKTATRLERVDIFTIGDLLSADVDATAVALNVRYIKAGTLTDWQDQTRLMVDAPGLRVLDSQILVGAGIRSVDELSKASAKKVLNAATSFLDTPQGARVLWGGENSVDKQEVEGWIGLANAARA